MGFGNVVVVVVVVKTRLNQPEALKGLERRRQSTLK